jgi:hypothetical protein
MERWAENAILIAIILGMLFPVFTSLLVLAGVLSVT